MVPTLPAMADARYARKRSSFCGIRLSISLSSSPPPLPLFDRPPALQNPERTQDTPCVSASASARTEVSWSRPTSPFDYTKLWLATSATPQSLDLSVTNGCSSSPTKQLEDDISACPSPTSISSQETEFHRSQSPVCLDDFGPEDLKRSANRPPAINFDNIRASPSSDIDLTEEERTTYALGIWYARYNGLWFPSIFPPTYIDLPTIILKDICSKAVDKDTMTFAHFADLMERPDEIQRTYQKDNFSATAHSSSSSTTPLFTPCSHQETYCRPAFWLPEHEAADSNLDDDLDDDDLPICEAPNDVSWLLLRFSYLT